jgi:hypothetical protein
MLGAFIKCKLLTRLNEDGEVALYSSTIIDENHAGL